MGNQSDYLISPNAAPSSSSVRTYMFSAGYPNYLAPIFMQTEARTACPFHKWPNEGHS